MPEKQKMDYLVTKNAEAIKLALENYSFNNGGTYPADNEITGTTKDTLLMNKILNRYPENPFTKKAMTKVPFENPAAGCFSYKRNNDKQYEFTLVAYGSDGIVYRYDSRENQ